MNNINPLPENKPRISGKFRTKNAIKNSIYTLLKNNNIEGRFNDDNWIGVKNLYATLDNNGIEHELLDSSYEGHGEVQTSSLPTRKVYRISLDVRDKEGKNVPLFMKIICTFIGKTGTMADSEYELSFYFM